MYKCVYKDMIQPGIARRRPELVWLNRDDEVVAEEKDAYEFKADIELTHPEWCLHADECGINTNQKEDGPNGAGS
jgi:hypothetical protein